MGIYIKGMEMPKGNDSIALFIYPDGVVVKFEMFGPLGRYTAVSVPPHGRLINADALAQQIERGRFHHTHTDSLAAQHHVAEYGHFLKTIFDAPTIIPASEEDDK